MRDIYSEYEDISCVFQGKREREREKRERKEREDGLKRVMVLETHVCVCRRRCVYVCQC